MIKLRKGKNKLPCIFLTCSLKDDEDYLGHVGVGGVAQHGVLVGAQRHVEQT